MVASSGVTWSQRPLIPAESREDLCMDEWVVSVSTQVIFLEEEIEGEVTIARLNYQGTLLPKTWRQAIIPHRCQLNLANTMYMEVCSLGKHIGHLLGGGYPGSHSRGSPTSVSIIYQIRRRANGIYSESFDVQKELVLTIVPAAQRIIYIRYIAKGDGGIPSARYITGSCRPLVRQAAGRVL